MSSERSPASLQSPPADGDPTHRVVPTACQYCVVGCGYEAHLWDEGHGREGIPDLAQAHWVSPAMTDRVHLGGQDKVAAVVPDPKCSMNKGNHSPRGGTQGRNLVHSREGPGVSDSTRERITTAYLRTRDGFVPLTNGEADDLLAGLVKAATGWKQEGDKVAFDTPGGLGVKLYEYQYLENTFVATTLFFQLVGTPNVAFHDRPSVAGNTVGFGDSGIDPHGYAYDDVWDSDVLLLAGSNPYESQSVFFMQYMTGKRLIVLDPRRTVTADYAEKTGGLHLQPKVLGADALVLNALAKYIKDRQQAPDDPWPRRTPVGLIATTADLQPERLAALAADPGEGPDRPRRARTRLSLEEYLRFLDQRHPLDGQPLYSLERAGRESGIDPGLLEQAARLLAGPVEEMPAPMDRRVSLIFEKGLIWGFNYQNTASFANLGLLLGSVLRPPEGTNVGEGRSTHGVSGRAGGHQKGWAEVRYRLPGDVPGSAARGYPFHNASDAFHGGAGQHIRTHHSFDAHLVGTEVAPVHPLFEVGHPSDVRLLWVIGSNAAGQMGNTAAKWAEVQRRRELGPLPQDKAEALAKWTERMAGRGLVVVQQDIYPNPTTNHADLVIPAAGWGEEDFARYTGERRLRLYSKFQDPPACRDDQGGMPERDGKPEIRCRPDWEVFREVALGLLPEGVEVNGLSRAELVGWKTSADCFAALAERSNRRDMLRGLVKASQSSGKTAHELLAERKTEGLLLPVVDYDPNTNMYVERRRVEVGPLWPETNPKALYAFVKADWLEVERDFLANKPREGELAICNGRVNELWNSLFTHIRNETVRQRWPDNLPGTVLEIGPGDAEKIPHRKGTKVGVEDGDVVEITCRDIHYGGKGSFQAVVSVQEDFLPPGMAFALFSYPVNQPLKERDAFPYRTFTGGGYVNNVTSGYVDPMNPIAAVKYARGTVLALGKRYPKGKRPAKPSYLGLSHRPRNVAFPEVMVPSEKDRLAWKVRELIVQKGLLRARLHGGWERFLNPEAFRKELLGNAYFEFLVDSNGMSHVWDALRSEGWRPEERELVLAWLNTPDA